MKLADLWSFIKTPVSMVSISESGQSEKENKILENTSKSSKEEKAWDSVGENLSKRYDTIRRLSSLNFLDFEKTNVNLDLDLIVEYANIKLTGRSKMYFWFGVFLFALGFLTAITFVLYLYRIGIFSWYAGQEFKVSTWGWFSDTYIFNYISYQLRNLTASGVVLALVYILMATGISCFRESTILLHRRHSLRAIRVAKIRKINFKMHDLEKIFGVNDVMNTGFDRIRSSTIKDNLIGKLIDALSNIISASKVKTDSDESSSSGTK